MAWLIFLLATFGVMAAIWRHPGLRGPGVRELGVAAIVIAAAGYGWQGSPDLPASPATASAKQRFDPAATPWGELGGVYGEAAQYVVMSSGLVRSGSTGAAVAAARSGLRKHPDSAALWHALGIALTAHAEGLVTPAASFAFARAAALDGEALAPRYFAGLALAQAGDRDGARRVWTAMLGAPGTGPWRAALAQDLAALGS